MNEMYENELVKKLNTLQGIDNAKNTILQYAKYIYLLKEDKIKGIGNSNVFISCDEKYTDRKALVNLLLEIHGTNDVHYSNYRELLSDVFFNRIYSKIIVLDMIEMQTTKKINIENLMYRVNQNPDKVFIVIDCDSTEDALDDLNFSWIIEVEESSVTDKQKYIENKLKDNDITISSDCISYLAQNELCVIDYLLLNLIINCKTSGTDVVTNTILEKYLQNDKDKNNSTNDKTALQQLDEMIGLESVKMQIHQIVNYVRVNKQRGKMPTLHMVFEGSSGTGKTEIARLVAQIFKEECVLSQGHLVEVSRTDLVAGYVGQTALKTQDVINSAIGGVLFIDEAYSLDTRESGKDFGAECISTLIKSMEDYRYDLCVILAGYTEDMEQLLKSNRGFSSRIQFKLLFNDYTADQLYQIFKKIITEDGYYLTSTIRPLLINHFEKVRFKENFGNGRYVRSLVEKIKFEHADRCTTDATADINTITKADVVNVLEHLESEVPKDKNKIGFKIGVVTYEST